MADCGHCSAELPPGAKFCSHCGEPSARPPEANDPRLDATHQLPPASVSSPAGTDSVLDSIADPPVVAPPSPKPSSGLSTFDSTSSSHGRFVPGTVLDERYRIVGLLGQGGMGEVYRAHDEALDRTVALKVIHPRYLLNPESAERFVREARAIARLSHPGIVQILALGSEGKRLFIAMEFLDGVSLHEVLRKETCLSPARAVMILA